jgi:hypothetical protein
MEVSATSGTGWEWAGRILSIDTAAVRRIGDENTEIIF